MVATIQDQLSINNKGRDPYLYCLPRGRMYSRPICTAYPGGTAGLFVLPIQGVQQAYLYCLSRGYSRPICTAIPGGTAGLFVRPDQGVQQAYDYCLSKVYNSRPICTA